MEMKTPRNEKRFKKLFTEKHTVNDIEVDIELKPRAKLIQQKSQPIPIHLQPAVGKEMNKLIKMRNVGKARNIFENCFVRNVHCKIFLKPP